MLSGFPVCNFAFTDSRGDCFVENRVQRPNAHSHKIAPAFNLTKELNLIVTILKQLYIRDILKQKKQD